MNILRYAFKNIFRHFFLSVSSILTITLLLFFVNVLLLVEFTSQNFITSVNNRISLTINFKDGYTNNQVQSSQFLSGMQKNFSEMQVDYISREDALNILSTRNPDLAALVENVESNPLPNSVRLSNISLGDYDALNAYIEQYQDILQYNQGSMHKKLLDYQTQYEQVSSVVRALHSFNMAVYVLIGLFLCTVAIVIHMIIRNFIFFLQDEIRIIELVGGKGLFIYGPFIIQGVLYMVFSLMIVLAIFFLFAQLGGIDALPGIFRDIFYDFQTLLFHTYWHIEVVGAISIGMISSLLASWKYMHSTIAE